MCRREGFVLLYAFLLSASGGGQNLVWKDTVVLAALNNPADPAGSLVKFRLTQELEYSFTFANMFFLNWQQDNGKNQVSLFQNIRYQSQLNNTRNFIINTSFVHDLGIQFFFDSISRFQPDENSLETRIEYMIGQNFTFSFLSNLTTRLFNAYDYSSDPYGNLIKNLNASFFTPLLCTSSAGIGWTIPGMGTLSLGLSACKLTLIRNAGVYEKLGLSEYYGVPKGKKLVFEYGLSFQLIVDKDFMKRVHWNCDLQIFKNFQKPIDFVMKNIIGISINRFLKTSIQTRLYYEKEVSKSLQFENLISLGFCFHL